MTTRLTKKTRAFLLTLVTMGLAFLAAPVAFAGAQIPNQPTVGQPPGNIASSFDTVLSWLMWGLGAAALACFLLACGKLIYGIRVRGDSAAQAMQSMAVVIIGMILAGSAAAIIGQLI